jgi:uncharacterized protein
MEFDWDEANLEHIARHTIEAYEAEEAVLDFDHRPFPAHRGLNGEKRKGILGKTENDRILVVILEKRKTKIRVVTCRDATPNEKRSYKR